MSATIDKPEPEIWYDDAADSDRSIAEAVIRTLDVAISVLMILLLGWLFAIIAIAIRLDSPGPVIFRQRRVGRGGQVFTVYKFRTMHTDGGDAAHIAYARAIVTAEPLEVADGRLYKLVDDRVTRRGRFLRRTSLDELPQLWNILLGQMSVVGPRPVVTYEAELYPGWYHKRFQVKPGLTGLWQVSGRSRLSYTQMMALDVEFVTRRSVALYLAILARTPPALLRRWETA